MIRVFPRPRQRSPSVCRLECFAPTTAASPTGARARRSKDPSRDTITLAVLAFVCLVGCDAGAPGAGPAVASVLVQTPAGTGGRNAALTLDKPYLILVGVDGFRHDYFDLFETPTFDRVAAAGVKADALIPPFPSLTFPSFYSIATGLYPGNHGIVGNRFLDPDRDELYSYRAADDKQDGTWYGGEPIWVTAETQGMVAAAFFFPATEADIQGVRPTFWTAYDSSIRNEERVDQVLAWLELPPRERPHMITLYFSAVDSAGHRFGPGSSQVGTAVERVDRTLARLLRGIRDLPHGDRVYLVIVSDHGMAAPGRDAYFPIPQAVDLKGVRSVKAGPNLSLFVQAGAARARRLRDALNDALPHSRAYLREELPAHLHARANPRIGDVVVVADEGYDIGVSRQASELLKGAHGWDPTVPSMHGIFLATGPAIEAGQRRPAFDVVHVYPFLADLLELQPNPEIDGDISELAGLVEPMPAR